MLKNIIFFLFFAVVLQACGGKDVEFEGELDLIVEADLDLICESQSFNVDAFKIKKVNYGPRLEQVEVQLATLKDDYSSNDACIPFSVIATNKGVNPIYLTDEQLVQLNENNIGLYGKDGRAFMEPLVPIEDSPILQGEPWQPGAQLRFAGFIKSEKIKLYAPSIFTVINRVLDASFQGPSTLLGITSVNARVSIHPDHFSGGGAELVVRFNDGVKVEQAEALIAASERYHCF
jgi:hypothetical protein